MQLREKGYKAVIAVGDIMHVRKPHIKGEARCRKNNRKVHTMASYKMKRYISYKSSSEEIPIALVNEAYTSITCHKCGATGNVMKRLFTCPNCGMLYNRDLNAAINIGNRFLDCMLRNSGALTHRATPTLNSVVGQPNDNQWMTVSDGGIRRL